MKKILLFAAVLAFNTSIFAQKKVADVAKFETETVELGKIKKGNPTKGTFTVTNISKEPLIIEQANPTCGCTISDYTKEPILPGKVGYINATYNAANPGHFDKHLTVKFAGIDELKSITLTGDVLNEEEFAQWEKDHPVVAPAPVKAEKAAKAKETAKAKKKVAKPAKKK